VSAIFYNDIANRVISGMNIPLGQKTKYRNFTTKMVGSIFRGTYHKVKRRIINRYKAKGLDEETLIKIAERLERFAKSEAFKLTRSFNHEFINLLCEYGLTGPIAGTCYAFANRIYKIMSEYEHPVRDALINATIIYFHNAYYLDKDLMTDIVGIIDKYYNKIRDKIETLEV